MHNAHLYIINKALEECDKVLIVLGSENKKNTLRNPYDIELREDILIECFSEKLFEGLENRDDEEIEKFEKIETMTLSDWSMESDHQEVKMWGRYFYYNIVSRINQKHFSIYYSDDVSILDSWFKDTEVYDYITYRLFERNNLFDGLSATKIREAFINGDKGYIEKYCPKPVVDRFDYLAKFYKEVKDNPIEDWSMK